MSIFRAYDIRGIFGKDLTTEAMLNIGKAFGAFCKNGEVVVARDFRFSGRQLQEAFVKGATRAGMDVFVLNETPIGICYFSPSFLKKDFSAYVSASHLPPEWNGIKFAHGNGILFSEDDYKEIEKIFISKKFEEGEGKIEFLKRDEMIEAYKNFISKKFRFGKSLKVVVDCGNGACCNVAPSIFREFDFEVEAIFDEPRAFPKRDLDPKKSELVELRKKVLKEKADMGIAYDYDGDRVFFVDEKGRKLSAEQAAYIFLKKSLKKKDKVVLNVECSQSLEDEIIKMGGEVIRCRVGRNFLVENVLKNKALFGVEASGHYSFPQYSICDDGILNSLIITEIISRSDLKISEVVDEMPVYSLKRDEIKCEDWKKFEVVNKLKEHFVKKYKNVELVDGVKIKFEDSSALIRASNTEPLIRLTVEAKDGKKLSEVRKTALKEIKKFI
jgi:phosphomannomutase